MDTEGAQWILLCRALLSTWTTNAGAAAFLWPVVGVLDGNTIEVLHNDYPERTCLNGIDCPERAEGLWADPTPAPTWETCTGLQDDTSLE